MLEIGVGKRPYLRDLHHELEGLEAGRTICVFKFSDIDEDIVLDIKSDYKTSEKKGLVPPCTDCSSLLLEG